MKKIPIAWAVLIAIVLVPFFLWEDEVNDWTAQLLADNGADAFAVAVTLFAVLSSDIFLPIPSCLLSTLCGVFLGPWTGFVISFAAMTVSSFTGFLIGRMASSLAGRLIGENDMAYRKTSGHGPLMLFLFRPVPVLAECSCVYAGLKKYDFSQSALWISLGNAVVSAVYVALGHLGRVNDSFAIAFATVVILSEIGFLCGKKISKKR